MNRKSVLFGFLLEEALILYHLSKVEPPDRKWQYLLFAAEPYETIAFKVYKYGIINIIMIGNLLS